MNILIAGATGLIGRALCEYWQGIHQITAWVRDVPRARAILPASVKLIENLQEYPAEKVLHCVVNLAGAPIFDRSWSDERKKILIKSRVETTRMLVEFIKTRAIQPYCFLSASAIGYYGDGGEKILNETALAGQNFTATLCQQWEAAASLENVRTCFLRFGMVFASQAGAFAKMKWLHSLGLGGSLGKGMQFWSWIVLQDSVAAIDFLLENASCEGVFNLCTPAPLHQKVLSQQLSTFLSRPNIACVPAFMLRILLGERSDLLLNSQRAHPEKLLNAGFQFQYPSFQHFLCSTLNK